MSDVELFCEKSFSGADQEIVDRFVEFQNALIEADTEKLDEILSDDFRLTQAPNRSQVKGEFISEVEDGSMDFSKRAARM